jgi:hypothetical protein
LQPATGILVEQFQPTGAIPRRVCTPATAYYSCCLLPVKPVLTKLVSSKVTLTVKDKTFIPVEKHFPLGILSLFLAIFLTT